MKPHRPLQNQEQSQTRPPKKAGGRYKFKVKVRVKGAQLKLAATNSTATSETKEPARRRRYRVKVKVKVKGAQLKLAATDSKLPLTMGFRFSCARRSSSWRRCRRAWMRLI